jgi:hypothetical protein
MCNRFTLQLTGLSELPSPLMARATWQTVRCPVIKGPHFLHQSIATPLIGTGQQLMQLYSSIILLALWRPNESTAYGVDTIM